MRLPGWVVGVIGKLSIWCSFYLLAFITAFIIAATTTMAGHGIYIFGTRDQPILLVLALLVVPTVFITLLLQVFFFFHALTNHSLPKEKRAIWAFLIMALFGMIVMPLYWYRYVHPELTQEQEEQAKP